MRELNIAMQKANRQEAEKSNVQQQNQFLWASQLFSQIKYLINF